MPKKQLKKKASALERFQDQLLLLLEQGKKPATIRKTLLTDPALAEFHDYIKAMDDHMIDVAAELIGKWSTKGKPS